jgi:hypothetical protein
MCLDYLPAIVHPANCQMRMKASPLGQPAQWLESLLDGPLQLLQSANITVDANPNDTGLSIIGKAA